MVEIFKFQSCWVFIANPYQRVKKNITYCFFKSISAFFFLGVLPVPIQKLSTWEEAIGSLLKKIMFPLFSLRDSVETAKRLHHVRWEHLQIFQLKVLTDVKSAHQVTSSFFCESRQEMRCAFIIRRAFLYLFVLKSANRKLSLNASMFFKGETLFHIP